MALQDRTGQKVPSVVFHTRVGDTWKDVSTDDLFKGKKSSRVLSAWRIYSNLLFFSPATLQRIVWRVQRKRC